jgi:hypothetical protein
MVTHQLMSTRHLQLVKNKKTKDMNPPEGNVIFLLVLQYIRKCQLHLIGLIPRSVLCSCRS